MTPDLWNNLPNDIENDEDTAEFKINDIVLPALLRRCRIDSMPGTGKRKSCITAYGCETVTGAMPGSNDLYNRNLTEDTWWRTQLGASKVECTCLPYHTHTAIAAMLRTQITSFSYHRDKSCLLTLTC